MSTTGFINKPLPTSYTQAASAASSERLKFLAKNVLATYIDSFMNTQGVNRSFLEASTPTALQYVTDTSMPHHDGPTDRHVQLAQMYNRLTQHVPCILIMDNGFQWVPTGLGGGVEGSANLEGKHYVFYRVMARVPTVISIVTNDEETTNILQNIICLMLGPFAHISGATHMGSQDPTDRWEVRLPGNFEPGANTPQAAMDGEPIDQIWAATIDLVLEVEDQIRMEVPTATFKSEPAVVGPGSLRSRYPSEIKCLTSVPLSAGTMDVAFKNFSPRYRISISNPEVAVIDVQAKKIYLRAPGTFDIVVTDLAQIDSRENVPNIRKEVLRKTVTITL